MTDFFSALEQELHAAAERRPRRPVGVGQALGALVVVALLAMAVAVAFGVVGAGGSGVDGDRGQVAGAPKPDPVGTVIPRGEGKPPRGRRTIVVANGVAPVTGPWQMEVNRTSGQRDTSGRVMWHRGWCLFMTVLDPPEGQGGPGRSGFCGGPKSLGFRKTPGFSRAQNPVQTRPAPRETEVLVWGRVPDRAEKVVISAPNGKRIEAEPTDGPESFPGRFYGIPVNVRLRGKHSNWQGARINWLDADGRPGSRGISMMPPISR
jgi:hypothetical protein